MTGFNQLMVIFKDFQRIDDEKPHCTAGSLRDPGYFWTKPHPCYKVPLQH